MAVGDWAPREEVEHTSNRVEAVPNAAGLKWTKLFVKMQERPGEWLLMDERPDENGAYYVRVRIKKYMDRWMPAGRYEMQSRRIFDNNQIFQCSRLYGRFIEPATTPILEPGKRGPGKRAAHTL